MEVTLFLEVRREAGSGIVGPEIVDDGVILDDQDIDGPEIKICQTSLRYC